MLLTAQVHLLQVIPGSVELLDVHPLVLRFPFEANKSMPCSLQLTNNTDEHVAFRLMQKSENQQCFARLPLYDVVPPRSTYTLVVTTKKQEKPPEQEDIDDLILQSSILGNKYIVPFETRREFDEFFEDAEETGHAVHEVTLKAGFAPQGETTSKAIPPITKILPNVKYFDYDRLYSLDAHPTEPLIVTGRPKKEVRIWKYDMPEPMHLYIWRSTGEVQGGATVYSVKFIARKQWVVAGTEDGFIHVYNYETEIQKITSFEAHDGVVSKLAVHPTQPYVMSLSAGLIKLWDWDKGWLDFIKKYMGWKCTQIFSIYLARQFAFNPNDTNSFASTQLNDTVEVCSLDSPRSKYTLSGHSDEVRCLDFFTRDDQQYLITGSDDCTAKIWDLQEKTCVRTLESFVSPVTSVISIPDLPILITGSYDGTVHMWSSTDFRLERIVSFGRVRPVWHLGLMGPRRIVMVQRGMLSLMDIDNEEAVRAMTSFNLV